MNTKLLIEKTCRVRRAFPGDYDKKERVLDIMEEAGELVQAFMVYEGVKRTNDPRKQYKKDDVVDALADMLYAMVILADMYNVDLFDKYDKVLDQILRRVESGEFERRENE